MNTALSILKTFSRTTVNIESVGDFLLGVPRYREAGFEMKVNPYAGRLLHRTDGFEFELRQYLAGETKTLYHLNRSIRTFLALDDSSARAMILFSLNAVEATILNNEWYELMPVLRKIRKHIQTTFTIETI